MSYLLWSPVIGVLSLSFQVRRLSCVRLGARGLVAGLLRVCCVFTGWFEECEEFVYEEDPVIIPYY